MTLSEHWDDVEYLGDALYGTKLQGLHSVNTWIARGKFVSKKQQEG